MIVPASIVPYFALERWAPLLLLLLLGGLPLVFDPGPASLYDEVFLLPKTLWLQLLIAPAAALMLWVYRRQLRPFPWMLGMFAAWLMLACLFNEGGWSRNVTGPLDRNDGLLTHLIYVLVAAAFLAWTRAHPLQALEWTSKMLLMVAGLCALVVAAQQFGLLGTLGGERLGGIEAMRGGGTLGHRGYMGGFLALCLPLAFYRCVRGQRGAAGIAALLTFALAATWSRGPWLAGAAALLALVLLLPRERRSVAVWARCTFAALLGLLLFGLSVLWGPQARSLEGGSLTDSSGRTVLYRTALEGIAQRPLWGWQSDGVLLAMHARDPREVVAEIEGRSLPPQARLRVESDPRSDSYMARIEGYEKDLVILTTDKVHNEYLDYAVSYGIPAALLFVLLLGAALRSAVALPAVAAALVAYAVYLLTWPEVLRFAPLAWALLGLALPREAWRVKPPGLQESAGSGT
ncbi:O-antigen ligase [Deinobacterium chartae]|uniref:O-antigen ligase n=1 Tax=Deinobacterium chartae TaxID=521158 RepID=A0A841I1G4_9DEIO|nr:O-antigen ligase family protein [Deinobacterium chartae]MBB6098239.1 O-antigen ligase [Deinobacterium chartae]